MTGAELPQATSKELLAVVRQNLQYASELADDEGFQGIASSLRELHERLDGYVLLSPAEQEKVRGTFDWPNNRAVREALVLLGAGVALLDAHGG